MSHARLRNAAIASGWSSRKSTAAAAVARRSTGGGGGGSGALIGRGVGTTAADRRAVGRPAASRSPMLHQPLSIPCRGMASAGSGKVLTRDNVFENLRKMEYAVRGPLLIRALEIEKELQKVR